MRGRVFTEWGKKAGRENKRNKPQGMTSPACLQPGQPGAHIRRMVIIKVVEELTDVETLVTQPDEVVAFLERLNADIPGQTFDSREQLGNHAAG